MKNPRLILALLALAVGILYFAIRLTNILSLPIFTDEAIYVRWSQIARDDAAWRFISLTDGKQPSYIWFVSAVMKVVEDPLLAGRLVSVFAGFVTMIGIYFASREIFRSTRIGFISALMYLLFPMALVLDRMALYDSLLGVFMVWSFYFTVLLARTVRLDAALILGMVIGGGVLTKTSAYFSIYLLPFSLLLLNREKGKLSTTLLRWIGLAVVASGLAFVIYNVLRLSPFFHIVEEKNALFVYPFAEWLMHPFEFFPGNLAGQFDWLLTYLTIPVFAIILLAPIIDLKYAREKLVLFLWFFLPFVALALFGKVIYPRFVFFMLLFLLPLGAYTIDRIITRVKNKIVVVLILIAVFSFQVYTDFEILRDFGRAPITALDLGQYSNNWPAGWGVSESVEYFAEVSQKTPIFIATQGTFGLLPASYEIYLGKNKNVEVKGYWPIDPTIPPDVLEKSKELPTYFVFYQPCENCVNRFGAPLNWPVKEVKRFPNPYGKSFLTIYKVGEK